MPLICIICTYFYLHLLFLNKNHIILKEKNKAPTRYCFVGAFFEVEEPFMVELDVKIEAGDLYDYMLMHTYHSASGLLGSGVGAVAVLVGIMRGQFLFLLAGVVLLLYLPWTLYLKSRQQVLSNPAFKEPLHYVLDEQGLTISQNGQEQHQDWDSMVKAVSTGRSIIVYTSKVNATIFPNREMQDKRTSVIEMISTHMPPKKVRIRG